MASDELGRLRVMLSAQTAEYIADVKKARAETEGASKSIKGEGGVGGINAVFQKLVAAGLVAKAGQMLFQFGKDSIAAASDVEESMSKARTVFGETFEGVEEDLGRFAEATGRSTYELIGFGATLQDTFVPLGFAREEAAAFSVDIVKLATDLGSFNNLNTGDVVRDIQSALVGNTETLRKYGVVASQAFIEQEALNSGLWDGTGAIDAQAKAQAIYQLILKGTTDAQGDAIRTSDSFANKQVALESAMLDLKLALADQLMPAAYEYTEWSIEAVKTTTDLLKALKENQQGVLDTRMAAIEANLTYDEYLDKLDFWDRALNTLTPKQYEQMRAQYENVQALREAEEAVDGWAAGMAAAETQIVNTTEATDDLTVSQDALNQQMEDLQLFISGPVGNEMESFQEKMEDLRLEQEELILKIEELESKQYLTSAQKQELEGLRTALGQNQEAMDETATAHEEATRRIIFDLIAQRAAIDGLSEAEFQFLNDVAFQWGLVDQATYEATQKIDGALTDLAEGESFDNVLGQIEGIDSSLRNIPTDINVGINIRTNGQIPPGLNSGGNRGLGEDDPIPAAHGLDMFVPQGYPNDSFRMNLALTSGERLMVLTEDQQRKMQLPAPDRSIHIGQIILPNVQDAPSLLAQLESYRVNV